MANYPIIKYVGPPASVPSAPYATPLYPVGPVVAEPPPMPAGPPAPAARNAVEIGANVIRVLIGGAAIMLGIVATLWMMSLAFALSATLAEAFKLGLIAMAASASLAGLPIAAAVLSRNYAKESAIAMRGWAAVVGVACVSAVYFTLTLSPPAAPTSSALRHMPRSVWVHSQNCAAPENDYQAELCADWRSANAPAVSLLPFGGEAADSVLRRGMVALLMVIALAGAGWLGRLYVIAMAETKTLDTSEASPQVAPPLAAAAGPTQMTDVHLAPIDTFSAWFAGSVRHDPAGMLPATEAYERYRMTCQQNGFPPLTPRKFGQTMTAKAEASGGQIRKIKTDGGKHFYQGLAFAGDADPLDVGAGPSSEGFRAAPARS